MGRVYEAIAYLTVHESFVKKGETQRRPGIHIEAPLELVAGGHVAPHELDSNSCHPPHGGRPSESSPGMPEFGGNVRPPRGFVTTCRGQQSSSSQTQIISQGAP